MTNTPRLQRILESAAETSTAAGGTHVGIEHIMLAVLADRAAVPTQVMQRMGLDVEAIVAELTATMQSEGYNTPSRRVRLLDGTVIAAAGDAAPVCPDGVPHLIETREQLDGAPPGTVVGTPSGYLWMVDRGQDGRTIIHRLDPDPAKFYPANFDRSLPVTSVWTLPWRRP